MTNSGYCRFGFRAKTLNIVNVEAREKNTSALDSLDTD